MNTATATTVAAAAAPLPWKRSLAWLLFLGPFFFLSYGYANHLAAAGQVSTSLLFEWERAIPFVPWTIVPYWSIDFLYGLSFLLCRDRRQVDRHGLRLLTAQLISVACFIAFPLHFSFERPQVDGLFGAMFDTLMGFDKPYNQAPSLHIGLLVIIWARFAVSTPPGWRWLVHGWALLIGASVLTTYQHHFFDIPTGVLVGLFALWLWPDRGTSPLLRPQRRVSRQYRLALVYLMAATVVGIIATLLQGTALWLWWAAAALGLVALIHAVPGAAGFQKQNGRHDLAAAILLAPYLAGAWANSRGWTRSRPKYDLIADDVWLGRMPTAADMQDGGFAALVDVTAELPAPRGRWHYVNLPWLDMLAPEPAALADAAHSIEIARGHGKTLVCCALGYSRSASAVAAWLLATDRAGSVDAAMAAIGSRRPIVLNESHRQALSAMLEQNHG